MSTYKNELRALSSAELRSRRDRLAASLPGAAGFPQPGGDLFR